MPFLMHMGNFCPRIKALKRSITESLEALIFMSMVYLNGFSGAANLDKDKNISPVKTCIRLFQSHQLSPWIGNKEILPYQVFVCRMSHQLEEK